MGRRWNFHVYPVSIEHHRKAYYPRIRFGMLKPIGTLPDGVEVPPAPKNPLAMDPPKPKRWGPLISDYGKAGDLVEKHWIRHRLQGTLNDAMLGKAKTRIEGIPGRLNPSVDSPGTSTCMVGGTTISLRATSRIPKDRQRIDKRQVGLYEESFQFWKGNYVPPEHGLGSTDATKFADEMVTQKALQR